MKLPAAGPRTRDAARGAGARPTTVIAVLKEEHTTPMAPCPLCRTPAVMEDLGRGPSWRPRIRCADTLCACNVVGAGSDRDQMRANAIERWNRRMSEVAPTAKQTTAWTYLKLDAEGDRLPDSPELPGPQTVYLGFDVCRNALVLGYTEHGGYHSMLAPNVDDDCNIVAFAPLTETAPPDLEVIRANTPFKDVFLDEANPHDLPRLLR